MPAAPRLSSGIALSPPAATLQQKCSQVAEQGLELVLDRAGNGWLLALGELRQLNSNYYFELKPPLADDPSETSEVNQP